MRLPRRLVAGLCLLLATTAPSAAQPSVPVDTFDLVLVGQNLSAHQISLRTNPWRSDAWTPVAPLSDTATCPAQPRVHVVPDHSTARYLGQDIRENYIALKITTTQDDPEGTLRAAYAVPTAERYDDATCKRLAALIAKQPGAVRRHSLASHVRPRPAALSGASFVEHLEAPIRHRKPGVMEVEWLEILFRPER